MQGLGRGSIVAVLFVALACTEFSEEVMDGGVVVGTSQSTTDGTAGTASDDATLGGSGVVDGDGDTSNSGPTGSSGAATTMPIPPDSDSSGDTMGMGEDSGDAEGSGDGPPPPPPPPPPGLCEAETDTCMECFECSATIECILEFGLCQVTPFCSNELVCMLQCDPMDGGCLSGCGFGFANDAYECMQESCPGCSV